MSSVSSNAPIALTVQVEIKPEALEEFLKIIEVDAKDSCAKENGGCLRFDVLRSKITPNKFTFYEVVNASRRSIIKSPTVYTDAAALAFHKTTEHYKLWTDFKATGAVLSQAVEQSDALFFGRE